MTRVSRSLLITAVLTAGAFAHAQEAAPWSIVPEANESASQPLALPDRDALGLPGLRPRLTMSLPLERQEPGYGNASESAFSWSLETWQLNTASLAHIQCDSARLTFDTYLAQDCRFVDQPLPENSVNLVQVRGDWMAAPGLNFGISAFHGQDDSSPLASIHQPWQAGYGQDFGLHAGHNRINALEGLDFNVSFGIQSERVGDFLVGLQLARYRQRMSLMDLGLPADFWTTGQDDLSQYANSAQLLLGWRRGSFSGEMLGQHREVPLWLGSEPGYSALNSFDLEFSWHAMRNASFSVGVSNVLDTAPQADDLANEPRLEDQVDSIYGRIPYVRYKHDL